MKIKPSGSGGARTLFRHSLRPHTHSYAAHLAAVVAENGTDKRAERVQSQYFRKASAEALKATGKVWFFFILRVERVENMDSIKTRTDLFPSPKRPLRSSS